MKSADIAAALVAGFQQNNNGNTDIGWHTGVVQTWDEQTGLNSITIAGNTFDNLSVLSTGAVTPLQPGDVVGIIRVQSKYFVLGKVRAPGAGAAERIASARVAALVTRGPTGFADLPGSYGPEVSVYVGSACRVLVIHSCEIAVSQANGYQGVQVSGASTIAPEAGVTDAYLGYLNNDSPAAADSVRASASATTLVTAAQGLQQGINTFTCKYKVTTVGTGTGASFNNRVLSVIPI